MRKIKVFIGFNQKSLVTFGVELPTAVKTVAGSFVSKHNKERKIMAKAEKRVLVLTAGDNSAYMLFFELLKKHFDNEGITLFTICRDYTDEAQLLKFIDDNGNWGSVLVINNSEAPLSEPLEKLIYCFTNRKLCSYSLTNDPLMTVEECLSLVYDRAVKRLD